MIETAPKFQPPYLVRDDTGRTILATPTRAEATRIALALARWSGYGDVVDATIPRVVYVGLGSDATVDQIERSRLLGR